MSSNDDYSVRTLTPEDWQDFAHIRLEALQIYPQNFGSSFKNESQNTQIEWQKWLGFTDGRVFGLYLGTLLVGITAIRPLKEDPTTGFMIASYIKAEHQGKGLSEKLYKTRIDWALAHSPWTRLITSHRDGNESSRRANQKHGFTYTHRVGKTWADGSVNDDIYYELDLKTLRQKQ
jgi:RimJ/RimL family protein N-acetyltransferase